MEDQPLVSIIVNCFNGAKYLEDALESIVGQSYSNWEIIFWDNQSSDNSAAIFKRYEDDRFRYFYAPSHTIIYEARNYAIEKSRGDYIAFLDTDDLWAADKLSNQIPLFKDPDVGFVCSKAWLLNEEFNSTTKLHPNNIPVGWVLKELLKDYYLIMSSLVIRRSAFEETQFGFDKQLHILGDIDFFIPLAADWKLGCPEQELMSYRMHSSNIGQTQRELHLREFEIVIKKFQANKKICELSEFDVLKTQLLYARAKRQIAKKKWKDEDEDRDREWRRFGE